jgi:hypothetical protein
MGFRWIWSSGVTVRRDCGSTAENAIDEHRQLSRRGGDRLGLADPVGGVRRRVGDLNYDDQGAQAYEESHRTRTLQNLRNRARMLGFGLVDLETGETIPGTVS